MPRNPSQAATILGRRIRERRKHLNLTQDQLANEVGIDAANLRAYESGRRLPNLYTVVRISGALDVQPGDLINEIEAQSFLEPLYDIRHRN